MRRLSKTDHERIKTEVFQLHTQRKTNMFIASVVGVSDTTVANMIKEVYSETLAPIAQIEITKDLNLLQQVMEIAFKRYEDSSGDPADFPPIKQALEHRAKIIGMYAPENTNVSVSVTQLTQEDVELAELLNERKVRNASIEAELKAISQGDSNA